MINPNVPAVTWRTSTNDLAHGVKAKEIDTALKQVEELRGMMKKNVTEAGVYAIAEDAVHPANVRHRVQRPLPVPSALQEGSARLPTPRQRAPMASPTCMQLAELLTPAFNTIRIATFAPAGARRSAEAPDEPTAAGQAQRARDRGRDAAREVRGGG